MRGYAVDGAGGGPRVMLTPDRLSNGDSTPSIFKRIECIILRPVPVLYHFSW